MGSKKRSKIFLGCGVAVAAFFLILIVLIVWAVVTLDSDIKEKAEQQLQDFNALADDVAAEKSGYETLLAEVASSEKRGAKIPKIREIMKRDEFDKVWAKADEELTKAKEIAAEIESLLDENSSDDDELVQKKTIELNVAMNGAKQLYKQPGERVVYLIDLIKSAGPTLEKVKKEVTDALTRQAARFEEPLAFAVISPPEGPTGGNPAPENPPAGGGGALSDRVSKRQGDDKATRVKVTLSQAADLSMQAFPHKKNDLEEKLSAYALARKVAQSKLAKAEKEYAKGVTSPEFDIGFFSDYLDDAQTYSDETEGHVDALVDSLEDLNSDYRVYVSELTKRPEFQVNIVQEGWGSYTSFNKWEKVSESQFEKYQKNPIIASDPDSLESGRYTEVADDKIVYSFAALQTNELNGTASKPEQVTIGEEDYEDYLAAALFFETQVTDFSVARKPCSSLKEDGEPVCETVTCDKLLVEAKTLGQYEDEATTVPSPGNMPTANIGDEDYGKWEGSGDNRRWVWSPWYTRSYSGLGTGLFLGYMMGGRSYYPYSGYYRNYNTWRYNNYRSSDSWSYDESGRRKYRGIRRGAAYHPNTVRSGVRGAGPRTRGGGPRAGK